MGSRKVRQHVTKQSVVLLVFIVGLFFEAYMHNFNLVYIALFFLLGLAMAAIPVGILNIGKLRPHWEGCGRLFANEEGACRVRIDNPSSTPAWGIDLVCGEKSVKTPPIPPRDRLEAAIPFLAKRRGRTRPGPCRLESLFPLATVRFELPLSGIGEVIVYPTPRGRPLESFLRQMRSPYGHETDFDGLESYSGTENASRIHWPSVARGETMVKAFETERESETLLFDFHTCAAHDEARLSQLTLWVLECERRGVPFAIRMPGGVLQSRKEGIDAILETLALY